MEIFRFCVITFESIRIQTRNELQNNRSNLSFVKDKYIVGKKWPDMVVKRPFISFYFLRVSQACARPLFTSEAIISEPIKMQTRSAPQNDRRKLTFVKDNHTVGKKKARDGHKKGHLIVLFIFTQTICGRLFQIVWPSQKT